MEKLATTAVLRQIALGEIDLDEITEVLRSSDLVIKSYRAEVEGLRRNQEDLTQNVEKEKKAVDDLTKRLVNLHEENQLAKEVFGTEIEGKLQILGTGSVLDIEALDMAGLIRQREQVQKQVGKALGQGNR